MDDEYQTLLSTLGSNLKSIMKSEGISYPMLSEWSGVAVNTIANYCNGKCEPSLVKMLQMCQVLGVTLDEVCGIHKTNRYTIKPIKYLGSDDNHH